MIIPKPVAQKDTPPDRMEEYKKRWKALFNAIDPTRIQAYIEGDAEFPDTYVMLMKPSKLSDNWNVDIKLFIRFSSAYDIYGSEAYLCPYNLAFASNWIEYVDDNIDTLREQATWAEFYGMLVATATSYLGRIPAPPTQ